MDCAYCTKKHENNTIIRKPRIVITQLKMPQALFLDYISFSQPYYETTLFHENHCFFFICLLTCP